MGLHQITNMPGSTPLHIALFMAIFSDWEMQKYPPMITTSRKRLMNLARIKSPISYHRVITVLIDSGLIEYVPSYDPYQKTKIKFNILI